ncbi:MAG: thymidylate kinase [Oscillospiraceae bacterium]|nr:thymidylate kinase [Oscillospiraceae bacterium]
MKKKLIVIEGLDGSGKATQSGLLYTFLQKEYGCETGACLRQVSFPDYESDSSALVKMYLAGQFGSKPEDVNAYAASSFYAVDRYASFKRDWKRDWESGIIIADRYTTSNAIHQCSKLPEKMWDEYLDWLFHYEYALLGIPEPSMVIYLRVDPAVSQRLLTLRYEGQEKRDIHERDREYLARCQKAAAYCAEKLGWRVVECCRDGEMRSIEEIQQELLPLVREALSSPAEETGAASPTPREEV